MICPLVNFINHLCSISWLIDVLFNL